MSTGKVSSTSKKIKKSSSSSSKKQKKSSPHEPSSSSVQKSGSNRIYSSKDVIKILEALLDLPAEDNSREPNVAAGLILKGIQMSMTIKISQSQLSDKLYKLRKKYCRDPMKSLNLTTPHEEKVFDLCNNIWVGESRENAEKEPEKKNLRSTVAWRKQQIQVLQNYLKRVESARKYHKRVLDALTSSSKAEDDIDDEQPEDDIDDIDDEQAVALYGSNDESVGDDDNGNEQSEDVNDEEEAEVDSDE